MFLARFTSCKGLWSGSTLEVGEIAFYTIINMASFPNIMGTQYKSRFLNNGLLSAGLPEIIFFKGFKITQIGNDILT